MNIDLILQFVENLQNGKLSSANVPQFRIVIDGVTKQLSARETESIYKNNSNEKRFLDVKASPTKLWPYGVTQYN